VDEIGRAGSIYLKTRNVFRILFLEIQKRRGDLRDIGTGWRIILK
jgi:hypothetical protein